MSDSRISSRLTIFPWCFTVDGTFSAYQEALDNKRSARHCAAQGTAVQDNFAGSPVNKFEVA